MAKLAALQVGADALKRLQAAIAAEVDSPSSALLHKAFNKQL
jgi:hypothetical protein